jgi:hypothetical protein
MIFMLSAAASWHDFWLDFWHKLANRAHAGQGTLKALVDPYIPVPSRPKYVKFTTCRHSYDTETRHNTYVIVMTLLSSSYNLGDIVAHDSVAGVTYLDCDTKIINNALYKDVI